MLRTRKCLFQSRCTKLYSPQFSKNKTNIYIKIRVNRRSRATARIVEFKQQLRYLIFIAQTHLKGI